MRNEAEEASLERRYLTVLRNERLTALTGGVLFVLFALEVGVTADLRTLILMHIFVGTMLAGPLVVKLTSVGYRFFSYYRKSPAFVEYGPPNIWLRLLAPFFLLLTGMLFLSGIGLVLVGPAHMETLKLIHAGSAALWLPLLVVHVYAHIRQVPGSLKTEGRRSQSRLSGRIKRLRINLIALIAGTLGGIILMPISTSWINGPLEHGIPGPLVLGIMATVPAMLIAVPVLRRSQR